MRDHPSLSQDPGGAASAPERAGVEAPARYLNKEGGATSYQDAPSGKGKRRLPVCARDLVRLHQLFAGTAAEGLASYALLQRLLAEQCEVTAARQRPSAVDDDAGEGGAPVTLKAPEHVGSDSLQSPYDAEATYNAHKGKGYEVRIAETCVEADDEPTDDPATDTVNMITHVAVTDACASDEHATMPVLEALEERGQRPDELVADTAFGSGDNALNAERLGTELVSPVKGPQMDVDQRPDRVTEADFLVDVRLEDPAICPAGYLAREQRPCEKKKPHVALTFERAGGETCALFAVCPVRLNQEQDGYAVTVDLKAAHLERRRRAMASGVFGERYRLRPGIEATVSELKRRHGLGALRVRGRGGVGADRHHQGCGRPARARTRRARGTGRLPESAGLQRQEKGAGAGAQTRSLEPGDGLKKGAEVPFGPEKRPLKPWIGRLL